MDVAKSALIRWSEALAGVASTGLSFTESLYEKERFEEILHIAAEMKAYSNGHSNLEERYVDEIFEIWKQSVGRGIPGYVTPKTAIGAIVGNSAKELLLVQRADSGVWLYPTGWADVGYSPSEIVAKEVLEETGIIAKPIKLLSVVDGMQMGFTSIPMYSMIFYCEQLGGELKAHPLECLDVGWFSEESLPSPLAARGRWVRMAFSAISGNHSDTYFDPPRDPLWESLPE
ncbi:MAG: NUDIX domain-containing protein [Acidimicrobiaceae bacterium]|nr:NUDIX domain-containing protein [Acidimicrobiaceae bacterium]